MHVCHIITRLIVGGAQENTLLSCEGSHARGRRVTLIVGPTHGPEGSLVERARAGGYEFVEMPELVRSVHPTRDWRALRRLRFWLRERRPDVVHTHSSKAGILGRIAAWNERVPAIVHTVHGMSFNRTQSRPVRALYRRLEAFAAARCHAIVGVADAMIDQMVAAGVCPRAMCHTVYSGMDVAAFQPDAARRAAMRAGWGVAPDEIVIGAVARLFRKKGYEQLLPALSRVAAAEPRARFVWVGDGAQRAEYEADLRLRGLHERTILTGLVRPDEIPAIVSGFDVLAHASQWEGLPRVAVQALLLRVPVVAFAIDGTPEVVIPGRSGVLVELGDLTGFADALIGLARDESRREALGRMGRELCVQRFDAAVMVDALERLYAELLARRGKGTT